MSARVQHPYRGCLCVCTCMRARRQSDYLLVLLRMGSSPTLSIRYIAHFIRTLWIIAVWNIDYLILFYSILLIILFYFVQFCWLFNFILFNFISSINYSETMIKNDIYCNIRDGIKFNTIHYIFVYLDTLNYCNIKYWLFNFILFNFIDYLISFYLILLILLII